VVDPSADGLLSSWSQVRILSGSQITK